VAVSVTAPAGFVAAGLAIGVKPAGALDCAFVGGSMGEPLVAAATFTQSDAPAAPVIVSREHLARSEGRIRGVVLTSGNANAATGEAGVAAARALCARVAALRGGRPEEYLVAQTGLIGIPFPIDAVLGPLGALPEELGTDEDAGLRAARAIMTTDTHPKVVVVEREGYRIAGMAKGAAMISPQMATMLAVITTDAVVERARLDAALHHAVEHSFNRITIDGCTSTNDTVVALASGVAGPADDAFEDALLDVAASLARQIVADAEGGSHVGVVTVHGARDDAEALGVARQIASSLLVKASLLGGDPYWGRVLAEVGAARRGIDPRGVRIAFQGMVVCEGGEEARGDWDAAQRAALSAAMTSREIAIDVWLSRGRASARMLTADIGHGYLEENRRTS
jgi:glutamate N-acetyltransferase/amino-acid N-acetyltransferase